MQEKDSLIEIIFKVAIVGKPKVGKSFLLSSFGESTEISKKEIGSNEINVHHLSISKSRSIDAIDTPGCQDISALSSLLISLDLGKTIEGMNFSKTEVFHNAENAIDCFIVVFDFSDISSFYLGCNFIEEIFRFYKFDPQSLDSSPVIVALVGNKRGEQEEVTKKELDSFIQSQLGNVAYFRFSKKEESINIISEILKRMQQQKQNLLRFKKKKKGFFGLFGK